MLEKAKNTECLGGNPRQSQKLTPLLAAIYPLTEMSLILLMEFLVLLETQIPGFASESRSRNILFFSCVLCFFAALILNFILRNITENFK